MAVDLNKSMLLTATAGMLSGLIVGLSLKSTIPIQTTALVLISGALGAILLPVCWSTTSNMLSRLLDEDNIVVRKLSAWPIASFAILPILFIPFLLFRDNRDGSTPYTYVMDSSWQILFVILLSCGLVLALLALRFPQLQRGPIEYIRNHPAKALISIIVVWIVIANSLNILQTYNLNQPGNNVVIFVDMLKNAFSDNGPFYTELSQADGSSIMGVHAFFIWYLIYPIFSIWPTYIWLITISNIALGLAAVPLYFLSRRFFGVGLSLIIVLVFLLNRAILSQPGAGDVSEERFLPLLLFSTFFFWQCRRYIPYLIFTLLMMTVREDVAVVVVMFGVLSLINRRGLKWSILPIILGLSWVSAMMFWYIPAMNPTGGTTKPLSLYSSLGDNNREIIKTLFLKPWVTIQTAFSSFNRLAVMYSLWISFGIGVPILSGALVLALPAMAEIFLADTVISLNHFNFLALVAALFPSFILGLRNANRITKQFFDTRVATAIAIITVFATFSLSYTWFAPSRYMPRANYDSVQEVLAMIPANASIVMPKYMMLKAGDDQQIRGYYQAAYEFDISGSLNLDQDFIIIDTTEVPEDWKKNVQEFEGLDHVKKELARSSEFQLIYEGDDLRLYGRI